jgi:hypothetical protein
MTAIYGILAAQGTYNRRVQSPEAKNRAWAKQAFSLTLHCGSLIQTAFSAPGDTMLSAARYLATKETGMENSTMLAKKQRLWVSLSADVEGTRTRTR